MDVCEWLQMQEPEFLGTRIFEILGRSGVEGEGNLRSVRQLC